MLTFNVRPQKGIKEYFKVIVFDSQPAMLWAGYKVFGISDVFDAITMSHKTDRKEHGKWRTTNRIGTIMFHKNEVTPGIVAHEMNHVSHHYMDYKKLMFVTNKKHKRWNEYDELIASMTGRMVDQFFNRYQLTK